MKKIIFAAAAVVAMSSAASAESPFGDTARERLAKNWESTETYDSWGDFKADKKVNAQPEAPAPEKKKFKKKKRKAAKKAATAPAAKQ